MARIDRYILTDSIRTTIAAVLSFFAARILGMPQAYWSIIATLIVMQSTLGATLTISLQRFAGTVVGALAGGLLASYFPSNLVGVAAGIFLLGLVTAALGVGVAYRFAGVTLTIITLIPRNEPAWKIAEHRFLEVTIGIAVGLIVSAVWPQPESPRVVHSR